MVCTQRAKGSQVMFEGGDLSQGRFAHHPHFIITYSSQADCDQIKERVGLFHFVLSQGSSASP